MSREERNRVAVVTGGGRGIGRAIAHRFAKRGDTVVVSARTPTDLDAVVDEIEQFGGRGLAVTADASDPDGARRPVEEATERFGRVDLLVNNVGGTVGSERDPFLAGDLEFGQTITLCLSSAWWATRAALPSMRENRWGRVINIGSTAATTSTPHGDIAYTAAKHGLVGFTRQLARAVAPVGITVNCVCPGWTNTDRANWPAIAELRGVTPEEARQSALAANVQHRVLEPEELTGMVALLGSDEGYGITGQVIGVDGGFGL